MIVSASILSADFANLEKEIKAVDSAGAHIKVLSCFLLGVTSIQIIKDSLMFCGCLSLSWSCPQSLGVSKAQIHQLA